MLPTGPVPPRISRETRLLLIIALVSLAALWLLARLRFPDRALSPNPLPPVLTQLTPRSPLEEIPAMIAELTPRLSAVLVAVPLVAAGDGGRPAPGSVPALRIREEFALAVVAKGARGDSGSQLVRRDPASGLAILRVLPQHPTGVPHWVPRRPESPRFLVASETAGGVVAFRPVFVSSLVPVASPVWGQNIWMLPRGSPVGPGSYLFTTEGALVGLTVERAGGLAVVPADVLLDSAQRLLEGGPIPAGYLGLQVEPLTPPVAAASKATDGVVVSWVDPRGPSAGLVLPTDVIEAVGTAPVPTIEHWQARVGRVAPAEAVALEVRRQGTRQTIEIDASAEAESPGLPHGLTLRTRRGAGAEVVEVQPGSAGERAGIQPGDVIIVFAGVEAPAAADVFKAFAEAAPDRPILAAVSRGGRTRVLTVSR